MRYPTLSQKEASEYVLGRRDGSLSPKSEPNLVWVGDGPELPDSAVEALEDVVATWESRDKSGMSRGQDKDALEGELSVPVFESLQGLPMQVLGDRGFWRFVAVAKFYAFVQWRDGENCQLVSFGAGEGGGSRWECVPFRMFNRAMIAQAGADDKADPFWGARVAGTDLWRSHILRVLIGNAPVLVNEVLRQAQAGKLPTGKLRPYVKALQRTRANVLFELLDRDQAREVVGTHLEGLGTSLDDASGPD